MNFVYVTKQKHTCSSSVEIAVTYIKASGKNKESDFRFSISENITDKVFRNVEYLVAAYDTDCPEKIWFKEATKEIGYKIVKKNGTRHTFSPYGLARIVNNPESFVGDYNLMYDHTIKMWYIDRTEKLN